MFLVCCFYVACCLLILFAMLCTLLLSLIFVTHYKRTKRKNSLVVKICIAHVNSETKVQKRVALECCRLDLLSCVGCNEDHHCHYFFKTFSFSIKCCCTPLMAVCCLCTRPMSGPWVLNLSPGAPAVSSWLLAVTTKRYDALPLSRVSLQHSVLAATLGCLLFL